MTEQYTYFGQHFDHVLVSGYRDGQKFTDRVKYRPTLFVPGESAVSWNTVDGKAVMPIEFPSIAHARKFLQAAEMNQEKVFGLTQFAYAYINERYVTVDTDASMLRIFNFDIETDSENGYGDSQKADREIISFSAKLFGKPDIYVIGKKPYEIQDAELKQLIAEGKLKMHYMQVRDEAELLEVFVKMVERLAPDYFTGWNIGLFDIPVIIKRIHRVFGEDADALVRRLSPFGLINQTEVTIFGKPNDKFEIVGRPIVDYMDTFKKFSFRNFESFKLDFICSEMINARKLDYSQYKNLARLYNENPNMFYDYNTIDVYRVEQLDEKMKFIDQVLMMAHMAKVNVTDTFGTVRIWEILIHNYLHDRRFVCPTSNPNRKLQQIAGAYVKDPKVGKHKAVMSFDWTSLYPSAIMAFNISPEMLRGRYPKLAEGATSVTEILDGVLEGVTPVLVKNNVTITGKGTVFANDRQGFIPAIMKMLFNLRKTFKKQMLLAEEELQQLKQKKKVMNKADYDNQELLISRRIAEFNNKQMAMKILANGGYGALSNEMNLWYSDDVAESVTLSGQLVNRNAEKYINAFMNERFNTNNIDYILYMDTDSAYLDVEKVLIEKFGCVPDDNKLVVETLEQFALEVEKAIERSLEHLYSLLNIQDRCLDMKLEAIGSGIWIAKKRYVMSVLANEGVHYDPPKIKMQGIDAVRSSTPQVCRAKIKEAIPLIIEGDRDKIRDLIDRFREEWNTLPFHAVASPRGVSDIDKYYCPVNGYKPATPIQARAALLYNRTVKERDLELVYDRIRSGDKIRFCYMKLPNPIDENVFAAPDELPKELGLDRFIDYNLQFEKTFFGPIETIITAAGIDVSDNVDISAFFVDV